MKQTLCLLLSLVAFICAPTLFAFDGPINYDAEVKKILNLDMSPDEAADSAYLFLVYKGAQHVTDAEVYPECERVIRERLIPFEKKNGCSDSIFGVTYAELGQFCARQGKDKLDDAREAFRTSLDYGRKSNSPLLQAKACRQWMVAELNLGDAEQAFQLSEDAIALYNDSPVKYEDAIARCYYSQAVIYLRLKDYDGIKRVMDQLEALAATSSDDNRDFVLFNLYSIAEIYYSHKARESSGDKRKQYIDSIDKVSFAAINIIESAPGLWATSGINRVWNYYNRAVFFLEYNDLPPVDSVEAYLQKALAVDHNAKKDDILETEISVAQVRAEMWMKHGDYPRAKSILDDILVKLEDGEGINNLIFDRIEVNRLLCDMAKETGHYEDALGYMQTISDLEQQRYSDERAKAVKELEIKYDTQATKLALAQSETRRANILMWLFASVGLLLIAVIIFVVYADRQRRRRLQREMAFAALRNDIGRQLTAQYIEGLENERRRMSSELHDGVCNDLLAIQMNIANGKSLSATAELIDRCRDSVHRISHELMPPEFAYASLDEVVRFFIAKQSEANDGKITFAYHSSADGAAWSAVPDAVALEVYRIVQESVSNAVRHSGASEINVSMTLSDRDLIVQIADNGTYKPTDRKGIGLDSIKKRANAVNGSVSINTDDGGTLVSLRLNLP